MAGESWMLICWQRGMPCCRSCIHFHLAVTVLSLVYSRKRWSVLRQNGYTPVMLMAAIPHRIVATV